MVEDKTYKRLIEAIKEKIPQRGKLTGTLVDLLFIEKEAIYRRLRGEVPFTFKEVTTIAKALNISLDDIIGTTSQKSQPYQLKMTEFEKMAEIDYYMIEEFRDLVRSIRSEKNTEYASASIMIPIYIAACYPNIYRFYIMKWIYQFGNPNSVKSFADTVVTERLWKTVCELVHAMQQIKYTYYIWDEMILLYFVNDINYFVNIRLMTKEEALIIKEELFLLLDNLDKQTFRGAYENGNKLHLYVSRLSFETTYSYVQSEKIKLTLIKAFTLNEVASLREDAFDRIKTWVSSLKRTSTLISGSGEMQRIMFFDKQRKLIEDNYLF